MEMFFESGPLPRAPQAAPRATHSRAPPDALPRELLGARDPGNAFQADPQRMGPVLGRVGPRSHLVAPPQRIGGCLQRAALGIALGSQLNLALGSQRNTQGSALQDMPQCVARFLATR